MIMERDTRRYYTLIAVILTYFMVMVACRAKGETDYSPTGATAKIPQLVIGAMNPESAASNILAGAVTAGSAVCWSFLLLCVATWRTWLNTAP